MKEHVSYKGKYHIEILQNDEVIKAFDVENQLTTINQQIRGQMLTGQYTGGLTALQIKYFAFGTGTTPAAATDTQLENEQFRKQITQLSQPEINQVTSLVSLGYNDANFTITEIGVFCGDDATSAANSGTLLSRVNVSIEKNSSLVINVTRTDLCTI